MRNGTTGTRRDFLSAGAGLAAAQSAQEEREKRALPPKRLVGVTMMPEFMQTEGVDGVLRSLVERAGVTAITTSPYVMEPADEKTGSREPPVDAGAGKVRLLDRPLWGKRELWVRTAPSFVHDLRLFDGLRYQPSAPTDLTRKHGGLLQTFIQEAHQRKVKVFFQVQAAIPPGYRVQFGGPAKEDKPLLPDGRIAPKTLANNASLGSREVRSYLSSLIRDIFRVYPEIDGLRLDWPEYPPYFLDDLFLDFSPHAAAVAGAAFKEARTQAQEWYSRLHGKLTNTNVEREIAAFGRLRGGRWRRIKEAMAAQLITEAREAIDESGGRGKELIVNAFPPPFNEWSGLTPQVAWAGGASGISVKFYTMHWPMMLRFYCEALLAANRGLDERKLVPAVAKWLQVADDDRFRTLADCRYPEPDEAHPAGARVMAAKMNASRLNNREFATYGLAHGYGPVRDFRQRLKTVYEAAGQRVWINRYGYLSDAKLDVIQEVCQG